MNINKVIVVIPMYNAEKHIAETIKSVLNQTFIHFRLIIIDDKSNDKSVEIASSFNDSRIEIIKNNERLGFFGNWNKSLQQIGAEYGKILPHDDILHPQCLESQVSILENHKNVVLVHCNRKIIGVNGKSLLRKINFSNYGIKNLKDSIKNIFLNGTNTIGEPGAVLFRTSAANKIGSFSSENQFTIDIDFWVRLLEVGDRFFQKDTFYSFRVWEKSTSTMMKNDQANSMKKFLKKMYYKYPKYINKKDLFIGYMMCHINEKCRRLIYKYLGLKS